MLRLCCTECELWASMPRGQELQYDLHNAMATTTFLNFVPDIEIVSHMMCALC